ncbi:YfiR family protein [Magnetococcus sp. PR-3]|uniref:YfiR family protein n=1 Tax=Magnetococcus sp. PR-3 TaxID=3120355 RepID=UPI002FCE3BE0
MFPSFLSADRNLTSKLNADGQLHLLILYRTEQDRADALVRVMRNRGKLRGKSIHVEAVKLKQLSSYHNQQLAGLFLSQSADEDLPHIIKFARHQKVILISPFKGDVEAGVSGGLSITDRVLPYINMGALKASGIQLKSFFLRVAKRYE